MKKTKILTFISGNNTSNYPGELYSEKKKIVEYFERIHLEEFEYYGTGWDNENHPCFKGKCGNYDKLYDFLVNMDEKDYNNYLEAAKQFINSEHSDYFSGAKYADYILYCPAADCGRR